MHLVGLELLVREGGEDARLLFGRAVLLDAARAHGSDLDVSHNSLALLTLLAAALMASPAGAAVTIVNNPALFGGTPQVLTFGAAGKHNAAAFTTAVTYPERSRLAVLKESDKPMSALARQFEPVPQKLENVRFAADKPLEDAQVQSAIAEAEQRLNGSGRIVVRPSGTEPLIRVMAEGDDSDLVRAVVDQIIEAIPQPAA